ncbi:MAG: exonuclease domain-containing protein, partial [Chloroflexales bacterium]|nr:exonuclease domain-containing protein [Chloroflexales bacterium]
MYDATMVAIDVEATGLSDIDDEVIEVAAVRFRGHTEVEHFTTLVKPSVTIPFKISRITNITDDMVVDKPSFVDVRAQLKAFIGDDPVLGHSVDFDVRMLAGSGLRLKQPAIDTFELATLVAPNSGSFKLTDLVKKLGVIVQDDGAAHRALYDARLAHHLFCRLYELLIDNDMALIEEVLRITRALPTWSLRPIFAQALSDVAKATFGKNKPRRVRSLDDYTPLEPTNAATPIRKTTVEKIFSTDGVLGRLFPGYEQREPQVTMSTAVAEAFNTGNHLIVEAGTGTGKGLAYLVPAALHAIERGQRVVLTTHTINLQDQLFFKDIPALTEIFDAERAAGNTQIPDVDLQSALLKGRSNYLCLRRLEDAKVIGGINDEDTKSLLKVAMWATKTNAGDRNEIALFDREMVTWNRLHAGFDLCNGPACSFFDQCWFFLARRQAEAAHLVV